MYQNARYVGSAEAVWRLFSFGIHDRDPAVVRLAVHLPNGQRVTFDENNANQVAEGEPPKTTLTEFFTFCEYDTSARQLLYRETPNFYKWDKSPKKWIKRKRGFCLGRMYTVSPKNRECDYVRLLLTRVRGPQSFFGFKNR